MCIGFISNDLFGGNYEIIYGEYAKHLTCHIIEHEKQKLQFNRKLLYSNFVYPNRYIKLSKH